MATDGNDERAPTPHDARNFLQRSMAWLLGALRPVMVAVEDQDIRNALLTAVGVMPDGSGQLQIPGTLKDNLDSYVSGTDPTLDAFMETAGEVIEVAEALRDLFSAFGAHDPDEGASDMLRLLEILLIVFSRNRTPGLYAVMRAVGFIDEEIDEAETRNETFRMDRFEQAVTQVGAYFSSLFQTPTTTPAPHTSEVDVTTESDRWAVPLAVGFVFLNKISALRNLKIWSVYGWDAPTTTTPVADEIANRTLSFAVDFGFKSGAAQEQNILFLTMAFVPREHGGQAGLYLSLGLDAAVSIPISNTITLTVGFDAEGAVGFFIPVDGGQGAVQGSPNGGFTLTLAQASPSSAQPQVFGDPHGTRLQWRDWSLLVALQMQEATPGTPTFRFDARLTVQEAALVIKKGTGDGFLNRILPDGETTINFDLTVGYATDRGLYFSGGGGLRLLIPLQLQLGPLRIQSILIDIEPQAAAPGSSTGSSLTAELASSFGLVLGPIQASVQEMGLALDLAFPRGASPTVNLGFKPPRGIGFSIDASVVAGGGFLFFDPDHGQYAGVGTLTIESCITVDLIGIVTTIPPPAGSPPSAGPSYSMLFLVTVQFTPGISLFAGFLLTGIGGLVGIHRSMQLDVLRAGVKTHLLDSILFPQNPVANAPQVTSNLGAAFPPVQGHYVVGGMLEISYLSPAVFTLELGVAVEFNDDTVIAIFGQFKLKYPRDADQPKVLVQLDFVGIIDTGQKTFSFDGSLADSKILTWPLTGDMACRYNWGANSTFLFSFGGFNPHFTPPTEFPDLDRLSLNISSGDLYRVRFELYLAVTSNSFQIGARCDFFIGVSGFSIEGHLAFDVLVEWDPFHFDADIDAQVALKAGGTTLFSFSVTVDLSGPGPWRVSGKVSISLLFWSIDISFDHTFGDAAADSPPVTVSVSQALTAAIQQPSAWQGALPAGAQGMVSLRQLAAPSSIVIHPLADLTMRQKIAPLGVNLQRYGAARISGPARFDVTAVTVNGAARSPQPVTDLFAPGQYLDLSDDEKLSQPSFEALTSGVTFSGGATQAGAAVDAPLNYTTIVMDPANPVPKPAVYHPTAAAVKAVASFGASARGRARHTTGEKFKNPFVDKIGVSDRSWVVASTANLSSKSPALSFTVAKQALQTYAAQHPAEEVQLVAAQGAK